MIELRVFQSSANSLWQIFPRKHFFSPLEILSAGMIHRKERVANQRAPFMNEKMLNFAEK